MNAPLPKPRPVDLAQILRDVEKNLDPAGTRAFRAMLEVIRWNTARIDELERSVARLEGRGSRPA
jgi:hypothetical protein